MNLIIVFSQMKIRMDY